MMDNLQDLYPAHAYLAAGYNEFDQLIGHFSRIYYCLSAKRESIVSGEIWPLHINKSSMFRIDIRYVKQILNLTL